MNFPVDKNGIWTVETETTLESWFKSTMYPSVLYAKTSKLISCHSSTNYSYFK